DVTEHRELWIRDDDLGLVKEMWEASPGSTTTLLFDPPIKGGDFPLEMGRSGTIIDSWAGTTHITEIPNPSPGNGSPAVREYYGSAVTERAITVPAGTFPTI